MAETVATEASAPVTAPATPAATPPASPQATAAAIVTDGGTAAPEQATPSAGTPATPDTATSLLSDAAKPIEPAPSAEAAQPPPDGEKDEKAPDASASAEEPAPIVYEPWKAPEGITLDEQTVKPFNDLLAAAKVDQQVGQQLVDMHFAQLQTVREAIAEQQRQTWATLRSGWVDQVKSDPEMGGARFETALHACGSVIEEYASGHPKGSAEHKAAVAELREVFAMTGAGDHPAVVRLLHNVGKARAAPRPVPAHQPAPAPQTRASRRYAASLNGSAP